MMTLAKMGLDWPHFMLLIKVLILVVWLSSSRCGIEEAPFVWKVFEIHSDLFRTDSSRFQPHFSFREIPLTRVGFLICAHKPYQ